MSTSPAWLGAAADVAQLFSAPIGVGVSIVIGYVMWKVAVRAQRTAESAAASARSAGRTADLVSARDSAVAAHDMVVDLTTGDVAAARHVIGTVRYGNADQLSTINRGEAIQAFFTLLWCIERTAHGYRGLRGAVPSDVLATTLQSIEWHVREVVRNLAVLRDPLNMKDTDAWRSLERCAREVGQDDALDADDSDVAEASDRVSRFNRPPPEGNP